MHPALRFLPVLGALLCLGMAGKPEILVRFFVEANARDTERFATPITLQYPPRQAFIERVASISERSVKAIYPFQAADGSWGCAFQLDAKGRIDLEVISTQRRGSSLVVFVGTKSGTHQVIDMLIDRPVRDGIISIPRGMTELEIRALAKQFPVLGQKKK